MRVIDSPEKRPSILPKSFRAAVLSRLSQPLETVAVVTPEYLRAGQLLVELHYSGACASQINEIDGRKGEDPYLPHMLGHEGVGTVRWVGPGVSQHNVGDVVVAHWRKSLGIQGTPAI
jgi:D-arabinose 1-dehydrogenase-like Zn-dependent alcohol dehydrogenase